MNAGDAPCSVCKVVKHHYDMLTQEVYDKYMEREHYLSEHPELSDCDEDIDNLSNITNTAHSDGFVAGTWG